MTPVQIWTLRNDGKDSNKGIWRIYKACFFEYAFGFSNEKEKIQKEEEIQKLAEVITESILQTDMPEGMFFYRRYPDDLIDILIKDMDAKDKLEFYDKDYLSQKYNALYVSKSNYLEGIIREMEDIEDKHSMPEYFDSFNGKRFKENIPECNNMDDLLAYRVFKIVRLNLMKELTASYKNDRLFVEKYKQGIKDDIQKRADRNTQKSSK